MTKSYILSKEADKDYQEIYRYTKRIYGDQKARLYCNQLRSAFELLAVENYLAMDCSEVKNGLRRFVKGKHNIFYEINEDHILIVRILHSAQNIMRYFDED
jgi:toxin ParE1/3/4